MAVASAAPHRIGNIVRVREREWVVMPTQDDDDSVLWLRPLGGTDEDITGVIPELESITPATFPLPDPADFGDEVSALILREAIRLSVRNGAGPFRSFGRIAVEPRSYQLVPLLMALRLDPVRLLIADDVGIGKTIEAGLIARELLDRGEIRGIAVICPAHLCEQWQTELKAKFDLDAVLVRPGNVRALEREVGPDQSIFDRYPVTVVSIDYVKSDQKRDEFIRSCPDLVIVDEAHTSAASPNTRGSQQQRHKLLQDLVNGSERAKRRHLILTTATPHSGVEASFRSLLTLIDPKFADLPEDTTIRRDDPLRLELANHLVQRRRKDIEDYLNEPTAFPKREYTEETWTMPRQTTLWLEKVLAYARDIVDDSKGLRANEQRVSWWAALAMLRSAISSPEAAIAAFRNRAAGLEADNETETDPSVAAIDAVGQTAVLDADLDESESVPDQVPGADVTALSAHQGKQNRLRDLIRGAENLRGAQDAKLQGAITIIRQLLRDGYNPIVFCRYIATANYVRDQLASAFKDVTVLAATGDLTPEARRDVVTDLQQHERRILVATDCLSEGINLQEGFDAVLHYDLAWNPTRHEQRNGRIDRFGQQRPVVRTVMYYGADNPVDAAVMRVLIRKAEAIRARLGVIVAVPQDSGRIMESVFNAIFHGSENKRQLSLDFNPAETDARLAEEERRLDAQWDAIEEEQGRMLEWSTFEEKGSPTVFAQRRIKPDEVHKELVAVRESLGSAEDVERFVTNVAQRLNIPLGTKPNGIATFPINGAPDRVRQAFDRPNAGGSIPIDFDFPVPTGVYHMSRTSDVVTALSEIAIAGALDERIPAELRPARRCSVIRTRNVSMETTLAVVRLRIRLTDHGRDMLAEESLLVAWTWDEDLNPIALPDDLIEDILSWRATANVPDQDRMQAIRDAIADHDQWQPIIEDKARERAKDVLDAHVRVLVATRDRIRAIKAEPMFPVDILGLFIYQPDARA